MICARETEAFERYLGDLAILIFIIAVHAVSPDSLAYDQYSARVDERHLELLLDFFGNLDAPL